MKPNLPSSVLRGAVACSLLAFALPSHALYKVVGPDGQVTYTDRPPADARANARPVDTGNTAAPQASLPYELNQTVSRYPVTLYTMQNCPACDSGRRWLRERGVPYAEKTVTSREEVQALSRLTGGRDLPALTIGDQPVRGFSGEQWGSLMDVAGYPRSSQLPRNYVYAAPVPMIPPPAVAEAPATPAPLVPPPPPAPPLTTPDNPTGLRF